MDITELLIFAENNNIDVNYLNLEKDGLSAKVCDSLYIAIKKTFEREHSAKHKEVMAHEIAHCILNSFYMVDSRNPMSRYNLGRYEQEAKEFCIKWLLPPKVLKYAIKNYVYDDGSLWHAQEYLGVSMSFLRDAINYYCQHGVRLPKIKCYA